MRVSGFMIPSDKVVTCIETDYLRTVMDLLLKHNIGAVVVLKSPANPVGIITKTDLLKAYKENMTLDHTAQEIMATKLETCLETMNRDQAARVLERTKNHHAVVVNKDGEFRGLISSWDITTECAKDDRAWPWNRPEDGKFHRAGETDLGTSPTTPAEEAHISQAQRKSKLGDSFRDYIDNLGLVDM